MEAGARSMELLPDRTMYLITGYIDLRQGADKLCSLVQYRYRLIPDMTNIFLFCGRRSNKIKVIYVTDDTTEMRWIRFDTLRLHWPRDPDEVWEINAEGMAYLISGLPIKEESILRIIRIHKGT